jgi:hypothetical protein
VGLRTAAGGPFKDALNLAHKYVSPSSPQTRLEWPNLTLLHGDAPAAVRRLKESTDTPLVVMGSGVLVSSLIAAGLIDAYRLMIAPLALGSGRRLFAPATPAPLRWEVDLTGRDPTHLPSDLARPGARFAAADRTDPGQARRLHRLCGEGADLLVDATCFTAADATRLLTAPARPIPRPWLRRCIGWFRPPAAAPKRACCLILPIRSSLACLDYAAEDRYLAVHPGLLRRAG